MGVGRSRAERMVPDGIMGRPAMARTLSYFYLAGGALVLASLALPYEHERVAGQIAVAVVAFVAGARAVRPARSTSRRWRSPSCCRWARRW